MDKCGNKTLVYNNELKGWESFRSFNPDMMVGLNNKLYSFKDGDIWVHDSDKVPRNNFYGEQHNSYINIVLNDFPAENKVFKSFDIEGSESWKTLVKAFKSTESDYSYANIDYVNFVKKEGVWHAEIRGNEDPGNFSTRATYGVGIVNNYDDGTITINTDNTDLDIGDTLYNDNMTLVGKILSIGDGEIVADKSGQALIGSFIFGMKDSSIEGGKLRGYTLRAELENDSTEKIELFSVGSKVFKSFS